MDTENETPKEDTEQEKDIPKPVPIIDDDSHYYTSGKAVSCCL